MRLLRTHLRTLALGAALASFGAACSDASGPAGGNARFSVYLTDAPGDVVTAMVTIDEVYLAGGDQGKIVLRDEDETVDLLTLVDSQSVLVDSVTVAAGSYSGLHFVISGGYIEVENADGTTSIYASSPDYEGLPEGAEVAGDLQMPSFATSGLKVQFNGGLEVGEEGDAVLVDFDVKQSFGRQAGKSGKWVMSPVLKGSKLEPASDSTASDSTATP